MLLDLRDELGDSASRQEVTIAFHVQEGTNLPIKNYKCRLNVEQYISRIMQVLSAKGARAITVKYDGEVVTGISFVLAVKGIPITFVLPCNVDGVRKCLFRTDADKSETHARRVAWAIVKDWVEAQVAIIEAGQATMEQVFLPYAVIADGLTAFDMFLQEASRQKVLTQ